jgi:YidC/Oxa1 family membrane protein insertase
MSEFVGRLFGPLTALISDALELFHSMGAPWWLSIALLTVSVRVTLLPLTVRQVKNMRAMQELKPEMDEIRLRYKDDRQKQQEALMDLYKERRLNPLAGFLPALVQVPVFITVYQVVRSHEESFPSFASGGLLWFTDLTEADPLLYPASPLGLDTPRGRRGVRQER